MVHSKPVALLGRGCSIINNSCAAKDNYIEIWYHLSEHFPPLIQVVPTHFSQSLHCQQAPSECHLARLSALFAFGHKKPNHQRPFFQKSATNETGDFFRYNTGQVFNKICAIFFFVSSQESHKRIQVLFKKKLETSAQTLDEK